MTELCPDCGRPKATRIPDAISPKGPCARNFHPVGADDCMALTLERLRRELASAREIGELTAAEHSTATQQLHELRDTAVEYTRTDGLNALADSLYRMADNIERILAARAATGEANGGDVTDECEYAPGYGPCGHCYDGSACLPGGCGVTNCKRCGEACPHCKGTCELPENQSTAKEADRG